MSARIDIDGYQALGLINYNITTGFQINSPCKSTADLASNIESIKNRLRVCVKLHLKGRTLRNSGDYFFGPITFSLIVYDDSLHSFGKKIASHPPDQIRLLEHTARSAATANTLLNLSPFPQKDCQITNEIALLLFLSRRTDNDTHSFGQIQLS